MVWKPALQADAPRGDEVHRSADDAAPQAVGVNYQTNAGEWQSLGTYNLAPGAFLKVKSVLSGNVVADAFRFVYRGEKASDEAVPTPLPTGFLVTNNPPSREQQISEGDLAVRLGVTGSYYQPITMTQTPATFDDCTIFPREGCSGTRAGTQAIVAYEGITLTYRLASDALLVAIEGADMALNPWYMGQDHPQRVFLTIRAAAPSITIKTAPGAYSAQRMARRRRAMSPSARNRRLCSRTSRPSTARCTCRRLLGRASSSTAWVRARRPRIRTARRC